MTPSIHGSTDQSDLNLELQTVSSTPDTQTGSWDMRAAWFEFLHLSLEAQEKKTQFYLH
jgi:hypothetical protein